MSQTIPQMQERVSELLVQIRPMQADYDRAVKAWIASEKKVSQAYINLAERMATNSFGANLESLRALEQYLTADLEMMQQARSVGLMLKAHGAARDELRTLMHKITSRLTYALAGDLTSDSPPHRDPLEDRLEDQPTMVKDAMRNIVRSDHPEAKKVVDRATKGHKS